MKNDHYKGYHGRKFFFIIFLLGVVSIPLCGYMGGKVFAVFSLGGNIFFWIGWLLGLIEGTEIGKNIFIEDMMKDKNTRRIHLEKFNSSDEVNHNQI